MESLQIIEPRSPEDIAFEVAHAQGNGRMALEAAGIVVGQEAPRTKPQLADFGGNYIAYGEAMKAWAEEHPVSLPPEHQPTHFKPSNRPLHWRERRRA